MRALLKLFIMVGLVGVSGCTTVAPGAGEEAVLIEQPWIFGHGGVVGEPVKTGLGFYAPSTHGVIVNMQPMQFNVHFEDFMSKEGVPLDFDAALRLRVTDSVRLVAKFGITIDDKGVPVWYTNNIAKEFETAVRQAVRKHSMNETAISTTAIEEIDREISESIKSVLNTSQMPVELVAVTVGRANPPDAIKHQRVETAAQEQRANTEKLRKLAEDQRKEAEIARAAADNAYREAMKLDSAQFLLLETIKVAAKAVEMQREVCAKGGCTFLIGSGSPVPTLDLNKK